MPWWLYLWHCYSTPFDLLLTLLAVISYIKEDLKAAIVIGSMVPLSYFPIVLCILAGYMVLTQYMKHFYIRRFGWQ